MPKYRVNAYSQTGLGENSGVGYSFTWGGEVATIVIQDDDEIIGNWRKAGRNLGRFEGLCLQDATATVICSEINWLRTGDAVYTNCCFGLECSSAGAEAGWGLFLSLDPPDSISAIHPTTPSHTRDPVTSQYATL